MEAAAAIAPEQGWSASLELELAERHGRTVLERRSHRGPLAVQRVLYPEGPSTAHVYVLHPPGGVVGGDELCVNAAVGPRAHALLTTPAATKLYRSAGRVSRLETRLRVGAGGVLEWLPGETLAFSGARAELLTRVDLEPGAVFMGWEILGLGRPAAGERFTSGSSSQRLELWQNGQPLFVERGRYAGGGAVLERRWGLAGRSCTGTFVALPAGEAALAALRAALAAESGALCAATRIGCVLIARALSDGTLDTRRAFERAWQVTRPEIAGRAACQPRVWKT